MNLKTIYNLTLLLVLNMACTESTIEMIESDQVYLTYPFGFSQAVKTDNLVFLSGQVGWDKGYKLTGASFENQLNQCFKNINELLSSSNSSFDQVLLMRFYVKDLDENKRISLNAQLSKQYVGSYKPATTLIGVETLAREELLIEIEVIAKSLK